MKFSEVSIATMVWARNDEEEKILRASLKQLAALNLPVYITDGGSSENFLMFLKSFSNFTVFEMQGLWPQAKKSIEEAHKKSPFVFYSEPDKLDFFSERLEQMLQQSIANKNTGVILASRSAKSFASFPLFQQMTETTINNCCKEVIGKEMDYCYGPFLVNSKLISYLQSLEKDCGWGWRPFLFVLAHRLGFTVESYETDFYCPVDQRKDDADERIYRMKQLAQNINGITKAATMNLHTKQRFP
jgi:hypothetical protein